MTNVIPLRPMSELETMQIRIHVLTAYLDQIDPDWRSNIRSAMDEAMQG